MKCPTFSMLPGPALPSHPTARPNHLPPPLPVCSARWPRRSGTGTYSQQRTTSCPSHCRRSWLRRCRFIASSVFNSSGACRPCHAGVPPTSPPTHPPSNTFFPQVRVLLTGNLFEVPEASGSRDNSTSSKVDEKSATDGSTDGDTSSGLSGGAIAGIVIGGGWAAVHCGTMPLAVGTRPPPAGTVVATAYFAAGSVGSSCHK